MRNMMHIASGMNVLPLVLEINRQPWLWNQFPIRKSYEGSPHEGLDDIWVRYNDWKNYTEEGSNAAFSDEHDSVWYDTYYALPSIKSIIFDVMRMVDGERLGGVLITRIPPGKVCKPHIDRGWHAEYYDKYAVQLKGNQYQAFHFEGESFSANPGDVYWFDNTKTHWVTNESDEDRITMIICIRNDRLGGK